MKLYDAFVQDTNLYEPIAMVVEDGGSLTVDLYAGEEPIGRVVVTVAAGQITVRQEPAAPRGEVDVDPPTQLNSEAAAAEEWFIRQRGYLDPDAAMRGFMEQRGYGLVNIGGPGPGTYIWGRNLGDGSQFRISLYDIETGTLADGERAEWIGGLYAKDDDGEGEQQTGLTLAQVLTLGDAEARRHAG